MRRTLALALCLAGAVCATAAPLYVPSVPAAGPLYTAMSPAERDAYVAHRLDALVAALSAKGRVEVPADAVTLVRRELDEYAARVEGAGRGATIATLLERGAKFAPAINPAFRKARVPVVAGLYVAMIESEFTECAESPSGAKGMFQFLPSTAAKYGVSTEQLCDLDVSARAAARYLADRRKELGADAAGASLAVLSYNLGTRQVRAEHAAASGNAGGAERMRALWSALAAPDRAGIARASDDEGIRYLPRFFAAAIAGENPVDFGVQAPPLSSY